jgi:hypothetical protein
MNKIWHYTTLTHLEKILNDQTLKVSEAEKNYGIRPAVCFRKCYLGTYSNKNDWQCHSVTFKNGA